MRRLSILVPLLILACTPGTSSDNKDAGEGADAGHEVDAGHDTDAGPTAKVPGAPTAILGTAGNAQVSLTWTAPTDNGGAAITSYTVTASPGGATKTATAATALEFVGLTNGTAYTFTVHATNSVGAGAESVASAAITPKTVPSAPASITAVAASARSVTVTWTAPTNDGGEAAGGYSIATMGGTNPPAKFYIGPFLSHTVTGLEPNTSYTFVVAANNSVGEGPEITSAAVTTPIEATVPDAPTNVGIDGIANGEVYLYWDAPANNGGSAITGYRITSTAPVVTKTLTGSDTSGTIGGLVSGTSYTFTVAAINAAGIGPESSPSPAAIPHPDVPAVTNIVAVAGDTTATITWDALAAPSGCTVTKYAVVSNDGVVEALVNAPATSYVATGLTNGQTYNFAMAGYCSFEGDPRVAGTVAYSNEVVPTGIVVTNITATPGVGFLTVMWSPPHGDGGNPITGYLVSVFDESDAIVKTVTASVPYVHIPDLLLHTRYGIRIEITHASGNGPGAFMTGYVTTLDPPGAPTVTHFSASCGTVYVTIAPPANNGGADVTTYSITTYLADGSTLEVTQVGFDGPSSVYQLHPSTTQQVRLGVAAITYGPPGAETRTDLIALGNDSPIQPTNMKAVGGDSRVFLSWDYSGAGDVTFVVTDLHDGTTFSANNRADQWSITDNAAHQFTVSAQVCGQSGPESDPSVKIFATSDIAAPTNVTAVAGNASATVSWTAPTTGLTPSGYVISAFAGANKVAELSVEAPRTSGTVTGLVNGVQLSVFVRAYFVRGDGARGDGPEEPYYYVTPTGSVPGIPGDVRSEELANRTAHVIWTIPNQGASPITGYVVTTQPGGITTSLSSNEAEAFIYDLGHDIDYTFTVHAVNALGTSGESAATDPIRFLVDSRIPADVAATISGSDAIVTWSPPPDPTFALAATGYTIVAYPGEAQYLAGVNDRTLTVPNLLAGVYYRFSVTARYPGGAHGGESVYSNAVRVPGKPGAPRNLVGVSSAPGTVTLNWDAPEDDGGYPVTSYTGYIVGIGPMVLGNVRTFSTAGAQSGHTYTFFITATNVAGEGPGSNQVTVTIR